MAYFFYLKHPKHSDENNIANFIKDADTLEERNDE